VRDNSCPVVVATLGQVNPTQSGPVCSIFFHPWWSQKQWGKWQKLWKIDQIQQIETYRKHCETFCYNYSDIPAHIIIGFKTCIFPQNRDTVGTWICNLEWTSQYVHRVCNKQATTKALLPKRCVLAQCVTFLLDLTLLMYPIPISYNHTEEINRSCCHTVQLLGKEDMEDAQWYMNNSSSSGGSHNRRSFVLLRWMTEPKFPASKFQECQRAHIGQHWHTGWHSNSIFNYWCIPFPSLY
jgi:hypothetical protein